MEPLLRAAADVHTAARNALVSAPEEFNACTEAQRADLGAAYLSLLHSAEMLQRAVAMSRQCPGPYWRAPQEGKKRGPTANSSCGQRAPSFAKAALGPAREADRLVCDACAQLRPKKRKM